jgi:hypothetical protein
MTFVDFDGTLVAESPFVDQWQWTRDTRNAVFSPCPVVRDSGILKRHDWCVLTFRRGADADAVRECLYRHHMYPEVVCCYPWPEHRGKFNDAQYAYIKASYMMMTYITTGQEGHYIDGDKVMMDRVNSYYQRMNELCRT